MLATTLTHDLPCLSIVVEQVCQTPVLGPHKVQQNWHGQLIGRLNSVGVWQWARPDNWESLQIGLGSTLQSQLFFFFLLLLLLQQHCTLEGDNPKTQLCLSVFRYLDTSLIDLDVQPLYCRVIVKGKVRNLRGRRANAWNGSFLNLSWY